MKIGKFDFKDYAAEKPVAVTPTGEFLTAKDIADQPIISLGSYITLEEDVKKELTIERYRLEPDFKLGIIGVGLLTKSEVIEHIEKGTKFGEHALRAEMGYLNELSSQLSRGIFPKWKRPARRKFPPFPDWRFKGRCIYLKLRNRVLFCENTTDNVTAPFADYRIANVHTEFDSQGFIVKTIKGSQCVRSNFTPEAKKPLTVYIGGIGHGNYDRYTGHNGDRLLEVGNYDSSEVKDKSIHFLSCRTGRDLGPDTISNGTNSYAGYSENFVLVWDDGSTGNVDEFELFALSDSTYDIEIANGATAQEAYDTTIQAFNAAAAQVPNTVAATWLTWDRDHLVLHGDNTAKIQPYRAIKICFPIRKFEEEEALALAGKFSDMPDEE